MAQAHAKVHRVTEQTGASALPAVRVETALTLVIFGASGDLTARKLIPSLYAMHAQGLFPADLAVVGCARRDYTDEVFRDLMQDAIREHSRIDVDQELLDTFCAKLFYHRCDLGQEAEYDGLKQRLDGTAAWPRNRIFYLAVSPDFFEGITAALNRHGLVDSGRDSPWSRVVIEKPFGHDLATARALNASILTHLDEQQIYRIDHYLGKETVQNILSFRLANAVFEPLFNNRFVDHVQITAAETVGMESGRAGYYDHSGAIRDMVQNHLLQLLCLVAMEPPSGLDAGAIHNEKVKVLNSIKPVIPGRAPSQAIRAQYTSGVVDGKTQPGYLEEDRVPPDSRTDTYVALRLGIENWRWAGVPFFLRTGKRLSTRRTEIAVQFTDPPLQLFQTVECEGDVCDLSQAKANVLVFRIQPDEGISLHFSAKRPAMQLVVEDVEMDFSYSETWSHALPGAYERLLLDVMRGDSTLFTRSDEVEAAWQVIDGVLQHWGDPHAAPPATYAAGTWGPAEADDLLRAVGTEWRNDA